MIRVAGMDEIRAYGRRPGGRGLRTRFGGGIPFSGDFRSLMTTAEQATILQYVQPDLGVTLGGTPTAAGTTPPAMTLTGSAAKATGLRFDCPTGGVGYGAATYRYSTDDGATWSDPALIAATTPITSGPANGITANWPNSTYTNDNTWLATCAALPDQHTSNKPFSQATPAVQPRVLSVGLNGRPVIQFATSNWMSSTLAFPAPGTTPTLHWMVLRIDTWNAVGAHDVIFTDNAGTGQTFISDAVTPNLRMADVTAANVNGGATVGTWVRGEVLFANAAGTDRMKLGATTVASGGAGNAVSTSPHRLGFSSVNRTMRFSLAAKIALSADLSAATLAAMSAAAQQRWGTGVAI